MSVMPANVRTGIDFLDTKKRKKVIYFLFFWTIRLLEGDSGW